MSPVISCIVLGLRITHSSFLLKMSTTKVLNMPVTMVEASFVTRKAYPVKHFLRHIPEHTKCSKAIQEYY